MDRPIVSDHRLKTSDNLVSTLDNTIGAVQLVKDLVPFELAQGVLAVVANILIIVKNTMKNEDDFSELAEVCYKIAFMLWRATSGTSEISPSIRQALSDLKASLDEIKRTVDALLQRGGASMVFHASVDKDTIEDFKDDLNRFLLIFNTELNISANSKLDELLERFEDMRTSSVAHKNTSHRAPIPAMPPIFFGRNALVSETVNSLLAGEHVALIGPGGMGKSCTARAVLHHQALAEKYGEYRYFVRYDDIDSSQITLGNFIDRIARALGIEISKTNQQNLVTGFFSSTRALLVLDNAETFLDAALDSGRIADAIDSFGALPDVLILLTSRSKALPPNLLCKLLAVPVLGWDAAHQAFVAVYKAPFSDTLLQRLLSAVDYHPLSINLLAQAAVQNEWTPQDLMDAWNKQHAQLLETGDGKIQSLAITIELSLSSSSVKRLGPNARNFLQMVAFLPQGIDKHKLVDIFPRIDNLQSIINTLCKQSLMYYKGDYLSMLAPIRLHMSKPGSGSFSENPLLEDVRAYYYDKLSLGQTYQEFIEIEPGAEECEWIKLEDLNVERLLAFDLTTEKYHEKYFAFCTRFCHHLMAQKPRATALRPVILEAIEKNKSKEHSWLTHNFDTSKLFGRKKSSYEGHSLASLGQLAHFIGQSTEAIELILAARDAFKSAHDKLGLTVCLKWLGLSYLRVGQFRHAEEVLDESRKRAQKLRRLDEEAEILFFLGNVKVKRGEPYHDVFLKAKELCIEDERFQMILAIQTSHASAEAFSGNYEKAKEIYEETIAFCNDHEGLSPHISLLGCAEIVAYQGDSRKACELLDQARTMALDINEKSDAIWTLVTRSAIKANEGDLSSARTYTNSAVEEIKQIDPSEVNEDLMNTIYVSARNELSANELTMAKKLFLQCIEYCEALLNVEFKARSTRALGEIALLEEDLLGARVWFSKTKDLCDFMGVSTGLLYQCYEHYKLKGDFNGWRKYVDGEL